MLGLKEAGLTYAPTGHTWVSHGTFHGARRTSTLDHVYAYGVKVVVEVLPDSTSDHRPLKTKMPLKKLYDPLTTILSRNFKNVSADALEKALNNWKWEDLYSMIDVERICNYLLEGIVQAMDTVAPLKACKVRKGANLYLSRETLALMKVRDGATSTASYKQLRNKVNKLVRRDKLRSNLSKLNRAKGCPKVLWDLASEALGKKPPTLPSSLCVDGTVTSGDKETATALNRFFCRED